MTGRKVKSMTIWLTHIEALSPPTTRLPQSRTARARAQKSLRYKNRLNVKKKEDGKKIFALERDVEKLRQEVEKLRREKDHIADLWTREMDALTSETSENEPSTDKGNQIAVENQPTDEELLGISNSQKRMYCSWAAGQNLFSP